VSTSAAARHSRPKPISEFEDAEIRVERNATDGDTEVVIFAKGGDEGFRYFTVRSSDRRHIVQFHGSDPGQRELLFESPEPPGDAILAAYPEGAYHSKDLQTTECGLPPRRSSLTICRRTRSFSLRKMRRRSRPALC
jgi:hypothetical protein